MPFPGGAPLPLFLSYGSAPLPLPFPDHAGYTDGTSTDLRFRSDGGLQCLPWYVASNNPKSG
jgi:hypothetical protein